MEAILLASASLRRQDLLKQLGIPFNVMPSRIEETVDPALSPEDQTVLFARRKVEAVLGAIKDRAIPWVLGADTMISLDGKLLGKPLVREEAFECLRSLAGRTHSVVTGIALYSNRTKAISTTASSSEVEFAPMEDSEIDWYLDTGEWQGVAGAYRVQGKAAAFVRKIAGSYSGVVGLPLQDFYGILRRNGYSFE